MQDRAFRALVEQGYELIALLDEQGTIAYATPSVERWLGYPPAEVAGRKLTDWVPSEEASRLRAELREAQRHSGSPRAVLFHAKSKGGSLRFLEGVIRHVNSHFGAPAIVLNAQDITDRQAAEEFLLNDAMHDGLTSLPNENLFLDRLGQASRTRKQENLFAVLFAGLDRFEVVSDSLGVRAEQLIPQVARRLEACVRKEDTVSRVGGEEFAILLPEINHPSDATRVAQRIQERMKEPFLVEGRPIYLGASVGITLSTTGYNKPEDMRRDAELAMHRARAAGDAPYVIFDKAMHERVVARLHMESDLRRAVEQEEFFALYQPIVSLRDDKLAGFEALIRWQPPGRPTVAPGQFIQVAEDTGLIVPVGWWILREACRQLKEWQEELPAARDLYMSVNVSAKQLARPEFGPGVARVLEETRLDPRNLRLEITESMLFDFAAASAVLKDLRGAGHHLCVDDFGTGYSSLSYLSRLPIETLKIDRSFVSQAGEALSNLEVVQCVLALARNLRLHVTAEGIETKKQLEQLRSLECFYGQGYLIGRPLDKEAARALIVAASA